MSAAIEAVLRGAGLTDKPGEFDSSIHSWRCEHPDVYGACDCFQELVRDLAEVERAAAAQALTEAANELSLLDDGGKRGLAGHSKSSASAITHRHAVAVIRARAAEIRERGKP